MALYTSSRATKHDWSVLGPTIVYTITFGCAQILQLKLVTNYSVKASGRKIATKNPNRTSTEASQQFNSHIEDLLNNYKNEACQSMSDRNRESIAAI